MVSLALSYYDRFSLPYIHLFLDSQLWCVHFAALLKAAPEIFILTAKQSNDGW